ncbi:hypothetical protein ARTSIC4J27_250 [Pseudarthrobacter siccitolerans]|uniref:Uncharacterized protein n=1 Tax=Pseudarthrobacter siccitolerans TaxID=861266 RepID=A0A024GXX1_9MICC|nr:hypothetical protein [Pseudarthrobacter siccitolerans]CCQ44326.1 hypothetical protein ARTSIC4J27_250 [Pseudarthrobacter siccitolerans]
MNPEEPVCTCITRPVGLGIKFVVVFDPYCQLPKHKERGTYAGPAPAYEVKGGE